MAKAREGPMYFPNAGRLCGVTGIVTAITDFPND
jgi:hypothetical protein